MISLFRKTEFMDFGNYMQLVNRLDDIYFMNYVAGKQLER